MYVANVAGVLKPVKPLCRVKGKALPPAASFVAASSNAASTYLYAESRETNGARSEALSLISTTMPSESRVISNSYNICPSSVRAKPMAAFFCASVSVVLVVTVFLKL